MLVMRKPRFLPTNSVVLQLQGLLMFATKLHMLSLRLLLWVLKGLHSYLLAS